VDSDSRDRHGKRHREDEEYEVGESAPGDVGDSEGTIHDRASADNRVVTQRVSNTTGDLSGVTPYGPSEKSLGRDGTTAAGRFYRTASKSRTETDVASRSNAA